METAVIKKRLNTFKSTKGMLQDVSSDVVMEVLRGWETWPGKTAQYYREIGLSRMQMVNMIKKAKRLVKSGAVQESEFKELSVPGSMGISVPTGAAMEVRLDGGKAVAFSQVDLLVEFLKKMA